MKVFEPFASLNKSISKINAKAVLIIFYYAKRFFNEFT